MRVLLQAAIRDGYVCVNGKPQPKTSYALRAGDSVLCVLPPPAPLEALPEVCHALTPQCSVYILLVHFQVVHAFLAVLFLQHVVNGAAIRRTCCRKTCTCW